MIATKILPCFFSSVRKPTHPTHLAEVALCICAYLSNIRVQELVCSPSYIPKPALFRNTLPPALVWKEESVPAAAPRMWAVGSPSAVQLETVCVEAPLRASLSPHFSLTV